MSVSEESTHLLNYEAPPSPSPSSSSPLPLSSYEQESLLISPLRRLIDEQGSDSGGDNGTDKSGQVSKASDDMGILAEQGNFDEVKLEDDNEEETVTAAQFLKSPFSKKKQPLSTDAGSTNGDESSKKKRRRKKRDIRRLVDGSTEYFPSKKRKERNKKITFKSVRVYYFERSQGFTAVPTCGGITLGMTSKHHDEKEYSIGEFERAMRNEQMARYRKRCAERRARLNEPTTSRNDSDDGGSTTLPMVEYMDQFTEATTLTYGLDNGGDYTQEGSDEDGEIRQISSNSNNVNDNTDEGEEVEQRQEQYTEEDEEENAEDAEDDEGGEDDEYSNDEDDDDDDEDEEDLESYGYMMQPVGGRSRRAMLRAAGVRVDRSEAPICESIRMSRQHCGCTCTNGICAWDTCECAKDGIKCQVDRPSFPCACQSDTCHNPEGRVEFNALRVRAHYLETMMRVKVYEQRNFNDYECYSPQHIRFEESQHQASSYCNPQPPLTYQMMNDEHSISAPFVGPLQGDDQNTKSENFSSDIQDSEQSVQRLNPSETLPETAQDRNDFREQKSDNGQEEIGEQYSVNGGYS